MPIYATRYKATKIFNETVLKVELETQGVHLPLDNINVVPQ